jgi:hypothetical protein
MKPTAKKFKPAAVSLTGVAILTAAGVTAWWCWPKSVPSPDAAPSVLAKFVSTPQFAAMPYEEQQAYALKLERTPILELIKAANEAQMTSDERWEAIQNVMHSRQEKVMTDYFALTSPADRVAYLDKVIDEIAKSPIPPPFTTKRTAHMSAREQKHRNDTIAPVRQAQVAKFYADMTKRRRDRGLPSYGSR